MIKDMRSNKHFLMQSIMLRAMMGEFGHSNISLMNDDKPKAVKKVIPKGCKEYTHRGVTVVAISEKSAIKKINKKLDDK